jgi:hypothetical protein
VKNCKGIVKVLQVLTPAWHMSVVESFTIFAYVLSLG